MTPADRSCRRWGSTTTIDDLVGIRVSAVRLMASEAAGSSTLTAEGCCTVSWPDLVPQTVVLRW